MAAIAPPIHRGMTVLNRDAFVKSFQTLGVRVPVKKVGEFMKVFSTHLLNLPRLRNTVSDPESKDVRIVLLQKDLKEEDLANLEPSKAEKVKAESLGIVQHTIELDYNYWTAEQILHAVMPEDAVDIPSSYTQIGHIAHMNLRDECLPWKTLIGQVILDKNKNITTVVNKTNNIDTTFRFFKMEILAGQDNMIAEVKESNCRFKFDFSKVYWNSRLHTEHDRLVQQFEKNSRVCDVFAGVGPFALPAAKKGAIVYANDLNPESYRWLNENKTINKISDNLHTYNMDGREFIRQAVKDLQATGSDSEWKTFNHFVMNLPATAIEFLDAFRGLYRDQKSVFESTPHAKLPMIHCHCFTKSPNPADDIAERIQQVMGAPIDRTQSTFHWVRNVAPKKDMYCVSFPLSAEIAFASK
ncbi:Met-10+ like-protein-domain-containing protein [Radiomyces spectabilis]|uniref:Met-10+ like-protein-domain-containing protein n=1 Tax=Radiomyces spectabilis TaxID=64574 RepID=UPI0022205C40|nr:Met-10+ like-protein-domain-containing protein [Radiomyces spectabilis]KAI8371428.1 Met-10+ like-protein-domain-containing protein [Radiomyces spectabilis]